MLCLALFPAGLRAAVPALVAAALEQWEAGHEDLAFTQKTRVLADDGKVKEERIERYDPSLPDSRRWRLISIDGQPATAEQRQKWETAKNRKARKKVAKAPSEYLDLEHAALIEDLPASARFEIALRPDVARLLAVEKISVIITIDKESGRIAHIAATLRQPIRVLLGLARITDLDLDVGLEPTGEDPARPSGEIAAGSTAHVALSRLGSPLEYHWSEFKRVTSYRGP
ncbi:MAG: hypothetical protein Q8N18_05250 [Opitutaceae bacterium]|nr:hypothetical protein [Opitutaceae bacterium]